MTVRGWFRDLTPDQRTALLERLPEHDLVAMSRTYTEDGTLAYERALHTFTFRVELRTKPDDEDPEGMVRARAQAMADAVLAALGVHHEVRKVEVLDMASIWT